MVAVLIMLLIAHLAVTRAFISIILGTKLASQQLIDMPFAGMLRIINDRKGLRVLLYKKLFLYRSSCIKSACAMLLLNGYKSKSH